VVRQIDATGMSRARAEIESTGAAGAAASGEAEGTVNANFGAEGGFNLDFGLFRGLSLGGFGKSHGDIAASANARGESMAVATGKSKANADGEVKARSGVFFGSLSRSFDGIEDDKYSDDGIQIQSRTNTKIDCTKQKCYPPKLTPTFGRMFGDDGIQMQSRTNTKIDCTKQKCYPPKLTPTFGRMSAAYINGQYTNQYNDGYDTYIHYSSDPYYYYNQRRNSKYPIYANNERYYNMYY
jgi:hypothetical protein